MRTGAAISVVVHVAAMTALLVLAGVRPFDPTAAEAITVELVPPDEAPPAPKEPDPAYDFPTLSEKDQQKSPADAAPQEQAPKEQAQPTPPPEPAQNTAAKSKPDSRQAALQQKAAEQQKPAAPSQPAEQPQPQAQPEVPTATPDITSKFGMMFAMPNSNPSDFDAKATATANISVKDAAALREHLKSCSILPSSVTPADNVRVVLRVSLRPDGRLAKEPLLIEASASEKGPALMRSAMDAIAKCQPYAMLPPESYNEWRMLDLSFTPKDFKGG